jgi:hypothetical protein
VRRRLIAGGERVALLLATERGSMRLEWLVRFAATDLGGIMVPLPGESEAA